MSIEENLETCYSQLLGIDSPWMVESIKLNVAYKTVNVEVVYKSDADVYCSVCNEISQKKDHAKKRTWRHLDTMQFGTFIHAQIPRANCDRHGVRNISVPWSEPHSRFTQLFIRFAIDVIKACGNLSDAMSLLRLSWDEVHLIQQKAVERGMRRRKNKHIKYLGIDEKSFRKGRNFVTVLNDLENQKVLDVAQGKSMETADELFQSLSVRTRNSVRAVAADMAVVYTQAIQKNLPEADIVYDKFHLARYLNEAVESVWQSENRDLRRKNNNSISGTKVLWLKNPANHTDNQEERFRNIKLKLYKVGRAWQIKEAFRNFWTYKYKGYAKRFFKRWYFWATHSRLKPIIRAAKALKRHLEYMLTYLEHRITNAGSEGINSRIQGIKARARGFRNFQHYRSSILFHLGNLDLFP